MPPRLYELFLAGPRLFEVPPPAATLRVRPGGHQFLPVAARIRERYLVTYRLPAERLAALVPAPLEVDARDGYGFLSVCALDMPEIGLVGTPRALRFQNRELLYRIGVRAFGAPSFYTLRSDVSSRALSILGRFSHYRLNHARFAPAPSGPGLRLECRSADGAADAELEATPAEAARPAGSLFAGVEDATAFLLGMTFSVDVDDGRVRAQDIDHDPWRARFAAPTRRRFDFVERVGRAVGARPEYDHTLVMTDLRQTWRAARWMTK
jgi:uncharacterized protein YqjF (DUF2071 family)